MDGRYDQAFMGKDRPQESYLDDVPKAMTEPLPIPASAIEAAADVLAADNLTQLIMELAEDALRAAFDELGMEEEEDNRWRLESGEREDVYRLVSRWMPVNDVVEKP